ncbi:MAG: AAA family ATPase [Verrucomicrobia bacterium]|jgi:energy-coupling factor transporter ATP-binding protein EcfA2|nr:AAA family ATPase [Verrucomicrobiota bacterium]
MKLSKLRLQNFRCYKDEIQVDFSDITALVGRNDSGKSSLMDALDIFLNDGAPDKDDASKQGAPKELKIICEFDDLPASVVIDDSSLTHLTDEFLLNPNGRLEIHKSYSGHLAKPKCEAIHAYAVHPSAEKAADLLQLKNADLKIRAKELGVDLADVDAKVNAQIRACIRAHLGDLKPTPVLVPLNEDNAKKIWTGLKAYLPTFALFKSDRASTDQDAEAQDPLKVAIKAALKEKERELEDITNYVTGEVRKIAAATLKKLKEMDPTLASELNPTFNPPNWGTLFKASITGDEDIPINKRGSGVKRLVLLNFFRAKAEQMVKDQDSAGVIYGIEEPETSQHPNNQRLLLRALSDLSSDAQVILTTHTPMLARALPDSSLRYVGRADDGSRSIEVGGDATNAHFAKSLGVLPDSTVRLFIGVEGPTDIAFLRNIATALRAAGEDVLDLEQMELDGELIFFPLGGSTLALWSSKLHHLNRPEFHLYDRDTAPDKPPKSQKTIDEVNRRDACIAKATGKLEIENYIHKDAIIEIYKERNIPLIIKENFAPGADVPVEVARLIHAASDSGKAWEEILPEKQKEKESKVKKALCGEAARLMTPELLCEIDPNGDVRGWFADMKRLIDTD